MPTKTTPQEGRAIDKLKKMKRIVFLGKDIIALAESTKFIPGNKYSVLILLLNAYIIINLIITFKCAYFKKR